MGSCRLFLVLMLLFPGAVYCRIGESQKECIDRYGKGKATWADNVFKFEKNFVKIEIAFHNDRATRVVYSFWEMGGSIWSTVAKRPTTDELKFVLNVNMPLAQWSQPQTQSDGDILWKALDQSLEAEYDNDDLTLSIKTSSHDKLESERSKTKLKEQLEGL
jgi:hypothetical protein